MSGHNQTFVNVDISKTEPFKCPKCGNEGFRVVSFLRIVPALLSPTMRKELVPVQAFQCRKCQTIVDYQKDVYGTVKKVAENLPFYLQIVRTVLKLFRK